MTKIDLFSLSTFILFILFCVPGTCVFYNSLKKEIFLHSWSNNQLSCGILRKILTMRAGDYERLINYDWPYMKMAAKRRIVFLRPSATTQPGLYIFTIHTYPALICLWFSYFGLIFAIKKHLSTNTVIRPNYNIRGTNLHSP